MADLNLDIFILQTYNVKTLALADASTYPNDPPQVTNPLLAVTPPGFPLVLVPFVPNEYNVYNAVNLGIAPVGSDEPLPDGIYSLTYSVDPPEENYVTKQWMRIDAIQEKFDSAFLSLDMMECDQAIKTQAKVELDSIYYMIQGSVAAANNCATTQAVKLYNQADKMLDRFINGGCGCNKY